MSADMLPPNSRFACFFKIRFVRVSTETENVDTDRFPIADDVSNAKGARYLLHERVLSGILEPRRERAAPGEHHLLLRNAVHDDRRHFQIAAVKGWRGGAGTGNASPGLPWPKAAHHLGARGAPASPFVGAPASEELIESHGRSS